MIIKNDLLRINAEKLYLLAFGIYYGAKFYESTMFVNEYPNGWLKYIKLSAMILLILKVCFFDKHYTRARLIITSVVIGLSLLTFLASTYSSLFEIVLFIVAAHRVSFDKLLCITLYVGISMTAVAFISSKIGIISDLTYMRTNGTYRHAFGSVYPTNFAAHIFYFILADFYLCRGVLKVKRVLAYIVVVGLLEMFCNVRLTEMMILITIVSAFFIKQFNKKGKIFWAEKILIIYSIPLCAALSTGLCAFYTSSSALMVKLNNLLSRRLQYGSVYLKEYKYSLFGSYIEQHGNGGTVEKLSQRGISSYTYIDISYMRIMFMFGILALLIVCVIHVIYCYKRIKKGDFLWPVCIALIAISAMIDQHLIDFAYNPFIFSFLAVLYTPKMQKGGSINVEKQSGKKLYI